jgi:FkbM family methyltransferase
MRVDDLKLRVTTEARSLARRIGLIGTIGSVKRRIDRVLGTGGYESRFSDALIAAIRPGDVVWDVGANVGIYTATFADRVGERGVVCAFEPVPTCFSALERRTALRGNVRCYPVALGDKAATATMFTSDDPLGVTHSMVHDVANGRAVTVQVHPGDALVANATAPLPNVLKIDVEGFEEEVLSGLAQTLADAACRAVFVEVHFAILEKRGARHAPARIKQQLDGYGFDVRWTDASHLAAQRLR